MIQTTPQEVLFHNRIVSLDNGSYDVFYNSKRYLLSKETHLNHKLIKLYAQELGGKNFISLNYYPSLKERPLKPCEMSQKRL